MRKYLTLLFFCFSFFCFSQNISYNYITNANPFAVSITPAYQEPYEGYASMTAHGASSYIWSTGETTYIITAAPTITTTYTVTGIKGANTGTAYAVVEPKTYPVINITPPFQFAVSGSTEVLRVNNDYDSYAWSNGAITTSITVSPTTSTTYTLTVTLGGISKTSQAFIAISASDYSALARMWLRADTGVTKDVNNFVSSVYDCFKKGYNATQGTGANQPEWRDGILNNKPGFYFAGINDFLQSNVDVPSNKATIFIVWSVEDDNFYAVLGNSGDNDYQVQYYNGNTSIYFSCGVALIYSHPAPFTIFSTFVFNGVNSAAYESGVSKKTGTTTPNSMGTPYYIGRRTDGYYLKGYVFEVMIFDTAIPTADQQAIEAYFKYKYGL